MPVYLPPQEITDYFFTRRRGRPWFVLVFEPSNWQHWCLVCIQISILVFVASTHAWSIDLYLSTSASMPPISTPASLIIHTKDTMLGWKPWSCLQDMVGYHRWWGGAQVFGNPHWWPRRDSKLHAMPRYQWNPFPPLHQHVFSYLNKDHQLGALQPDLGQQHTQQGWFGAQVVHQHS